MFGSVNRAAEFGMAVSGRGMQVILHVDEANMDDMLQRLLVRKLYGLNPANVLVLPILRFCGYQACMETVHALDPVWSGPAQPAGSGFAVLSCGWTNFAYRWASLLH